MLIACLLRSDYDVLGAAMENSSAFLSILTVSGRGRLGSFIRVPVLRLKVELNYLPRSSDSDWF